MDERSTSLRGDPNDNSNIYPHSGNGVTQETDPILHNGKVPNGKN